MSVRRAAAQLHLPVHVLHLQEEADVEAGHSRRRDGGSRTAPPRRASSGRGWRSRYPSRKTSVPLNVTLWVSCLFPSKSNWAYPTRSVVFPNRRNASPNGIFSSPTPRVVLEIEPGVAGRVRPRVAGQFGEPVRSADSRLEPRSRKRAPRHEEEHPPPPSPTRRIRRITPPFLRPRKSPLGVLSAGRARNLTAYRRGSGWGAGGPPGLQIRSGGGNVSGGFDSLALPPLFSRRKPA